MKWIIDKNIKAKNHKLVRGTKYCYDLRLGKGFFYTGQRKEQPQKKKLTNKILSKFKCLFIERQHYQYEEASQRMEEDITYIWQLIS